MTRLFTDILGLSLNHLWYLTFLFYIEVEYIRQLVLRSFLLSKAMPFSTTSSAKRRVFERSSFDLSRWSDWLFNDSSDKMMMLQQQQQRQQQRQQQQQQQQQQQSDQTVKTRIASFFLEEKSGRCQKKKNFWCQQTLFTSAERQSDVHSELGIWKEGGAIKRPL